MSGFIKGTGNIMVSKSVSAFKELTIQKGEKNIKKKTTFHSGAMALYRKSVQTNKRNLSS